VSGQPSASNTLNMRWRVAGADLSAANYAFIRNGTRSTGQTSSAIGEWNIPDAGNTILGNVIDIYSPLLNKYPSFSGHGFSGNSFATFESIASQYRAVAAPDGFSLIASAGTITGTLRVYGYTN
jgi:hypothetical protein